MKWFRSWLLIGRLRWFIMIVLWSLQVSQLEQWMEEQRPVLESRDYGKSEEVTEGFLRKLDTVDLELENQRGKVESLLKTGADLEKSKHPNRCSHIGSVIHWTTVCAKYEKI